MQQFGKDKLRGVVTIDMSPLPLSPDPKWWTAGTLEELSQVATQVLPSSEGCREFFSEYATGVMIQHKMEPDELEDVYKRQSVCPFPLRNFIGQFFFPFFQGFQRWQLSIIFFPEVFHGFRIGCLLYTSRCV